MLPKVVFVFRLDFTSNVNISALSSLLITCHLFDAEIPFVGICLHRLDRGRPAVIYLGICNYILPLISKATD